MANAWFALDCAVYMFYTLYKKVMEPVILDDNFALYI